MQSSVRLIALAGVVLAAACAPSAGATALPAAGLNPQTVVLIIGRDLLDRGLPAFLQIGPGRFLQASSVRRACMSPSVRADSLLLFLPDSATCEQVRGQDQVTLRKRLQRLTGRWQLTEKLAPQADQSFVAIAAVNDSSEQVGGGCSCNFAPTGTASCDAQVRTAATPIAPVQFQANDVDSGTLTGTFSYQRDSNAIQPGLPATISSSCTPGFRSLQCSISGTAPAPAGILQLMLTVSDGSSSVPLSTLLGVLAPVDGQIFANGFDQTDCL